MKPMNRVFDVISHLKSDEVYEAVHPSDDIDVIQMKPMIRSR
jgi:hypothetical protein